MPAQCFPEEEMPKEVAYRMIKDDLILDGHPMLKYAETISDGLQKS
jgi:glutamate decarboxylase